MIIVDSNEIQFVKGYLDSLELIYIVEPLTVDYLVNGVPIEHKEIGDYISSLQSGHLNKQLYEMSKNYPLSYLIVVGYVSPVLMERKFYRAAYVSSLIGSSYKKSPDGVQGQIVTINLETKFDLALALKFLEQKEGESRIFIPERTKPTAGEWSKYILSSFPSIGEVTAEKLLKQFTSLHNVFSADLNELSCVIGKKRAETIVAILKSKVVTE